MTEPTDAELEALAVEHEAFGFGLADKQGASPEKSQALTLARKSAASAVGLSGRGVPARSAAASASVSTGRASSSRRRKPSSGQISRSAFSRAMRRPISALKFSGLAQAL